ncbi:MAG TPA: hypothetical protein VF221_14545 [Chloroflexota bacterium]
MTYQIALRALGAWLDINQAATGVRLLETKEGFLVQHPHASDADLVTRTITFDDIWELDAQGKQKKRPRRKDEGYQNLLRALGHELDAADARTILLAEVDDDILLTYLYPHYVGGFALLKHFGIIPRTERATLVQNAFARRKPGRITQGLHRLLGDVD